MGKSEGLIEYVKDRPGHDRKYDIDWSKIKNELGWKPKYSLDEGLKKQLIGICKTRIGWKRVKSGAYKDYYLKQYGKA